MKQTVVLALGGNALTRAGQAGTHDDQHGNALAMARAICGLLEDGHGVVIVHGNGPQVGALALQQEEGAAFVPPQPLFSLGAMTQGQIGSLLGLTVRNACADRAVQVASLVTHVLVDPADPAFAHHTKPIGPFFPPQQAQALAADRGWRVGEDAGRGYRRLVASPEPQAILEADAIRSLSDAGFVVIAAGGGGIPVRWDNGRLTGVEAVVDKDLAAQRLASATGADSLVLVTDVDHVALDFGTAGERAVETMTAEEADRLLRDGQFPPGSMGPKITAAVRFLRAGGSMAVVTSAPYVRAALQGGHGTRIVPSRAAAGAVP
ncbi:MAG TPA: carbamate kinase [Actinomycetota bacterium]|nr:carbamate kinase [Actinomycetota bacterium]